MFLFIFWLLLALLVGYMGSHRKIGFWPAFFWSVLLSPLIGFIFMLTSPSLASVEYKNMILNEQKKTNELLKKQSIVNELERLKKLRNDGDITHDEYNSLKDSLFNQKGP